MAQRLLRQAAGAALAARLLAAHAHRTHSGLRQAAGLRHLAARLAALLAAHAHRAHGGLGEALAAALAAALAGEDAASLLQDAAALRHLAARRLAGLSAALAAHGAGQALRRRLRQAAALAAALLLSSALRWRQRRRPAGWSLKPALAELQAGRALHRRQSQAAAAARCGAATQAALAFAHHHLGRLLRRALHDELSVTVSGKKPRRRACAVGLRAAAAAAAARPVSRPAAGIDRKALVSPLHQAAYKEARP